jgi:putative ABC transport system permease protein
MGLATTLARRNLLQHPARTLLSILGIAVGIATVVAVHTLDTNTVEGLRRRYEGGDWRPELEVSPAPGVEDPRGELERIEEVAGAAAFFQNEVLLHPAGEPLRTGRGGNATPARLLAVEARVLPRMDAYALVAGADIDPDAAAPQVLLGEKLALELGVVPGDRIDLSRPPRVAPLVCVDGELRRQSAGGSAAPPAFTFEVAGVLAPEKLGRRGGGRVVIAEFRWGQKLFQGARTNPRFWVRPEPDSNLEELEAKLAGSFAYDIGRSVVVGQAADERAYRNGVYMAGLLALLLGLYVIFHTLSMSLVERVREVGVLHALGADRGRIARVFLLEAVVQSGLGGALGLAGGLLLARELQARGISTLGVGRELPDFRVPVESLALTLLGVGAALLGSIFPLLRARGASTVEALRGERALEGGGGLRGFHLFATLLIAVLLPALYFTIVPVVGRPGATLTGSLLLAVAVLGLILGLPLVVPGLVAGLCRLLARPLAGLFPFAGSMAASTMAASPRRIAVSAAAIALVAAAFVGLKGMTASLRGEVDAWSDEAIAHKLWVRDLPDVPFAPLAARLTGLPDVLAVEPGSARAYAPFLLIGMPAEALTAHGPLAEDPALAAAFARGEGLVVSERVAADLGYAPGDTVPVRSSAGQVVPLRVLAVADDYGYFPAPDERMYAVVPEARMKQLFCVDNETTSMVGVRLAEGGDPDAVRAVVLDHLAGAAEPHFLTGPELVRIQRDDIRRDFLLFDLILGLTALLASLGVLNGQLLSALERAKELGVLRALGASRAQVGGMVWLEAAVMGLFGGLFGTGLGLLLTPVLLRALASLSGLELGASEPGAWLWLVPAAAVAIPVAAAAYPVWRLGRLDPARSVRTGG